MQAFVAKFFALSSFSKVGKCKTWSCEILQKRQNNVRRQVWYSIQLWYPTENI